MKSRGNAKLWLILLMSILALAAIGVATYLIRKRPDTSPTPIATPTTTLPDTSQKSESDTSKVPDPNTYPVKVYFSRHPESDVDPAKTFPIDYPDAGSTAVATYAVQQLIIGPNADLASKEYFTMVKLEGESSCSGKDFTLDIVNGKATLKFCRNFVASGVVSDGQAQSELTDTLKQFATITKVVILNSQGNCQFDLSGQNLCLQ